MSEQQFAVYALVKRLGYKTDVEGYITNDGIFKGAPWCAPLLVEHEKYGIAVQRTVGALTTFCFNRDEMRNLGLSWHLRDNVEVYYVTVLEKNNRVNVSVHYKPVE